MKKIIFLFTIIFNFILVFDIFGFDRWSNDYREYYGDVTFTETSRDVRMRQDDTYYYFDITQEVTAPVSRDNYLEVAYDSAKKYSTFNYGSKMEIVLAPFSNICNLTHGYRMTSGDVAEKSGFNKGSGIFDFFAYKNERDDHIYYHNITNNISYYSSNGKNYPMIYFINGTIRGERVPTGSVYRNNGTYLGYQSVSNYKKYNIPKVHDDDIDEELTVPVIVSKQCECLSLSNGVSTNATYHYIYEQKNRFKYTIKIKKNNLDVFDENGNCISPFRYCNVVSKGNFDIGHSSFLPYSSSINNSIDLSNYINCEHEWIYDENYDKYTHKKHCSKCMWGSEENHNFIYEYDGILNNRCICGCNKNVYITIKDNIGKLDKRILSTPNEIIESINFENVGYDFVEIEDKLLKYYSIDEYEYIISTTSYIPTLVSNNSHEYNIKYNIHKYKINYNTNNNLNLNFENQMPQQIVSYGEKVNLYKSLYIKNGYTFLGWAVAPKLDEVVFNDEKEIYNLSSVDNYELNLYPVFDAYNYILKFNTSRGTGYMANQVCTYGVEENINNFSFNLDNSSVFMGWKYNNNLISPNTTTTLEKFVTNDNCILELNAKIYVREKNEKGGGDSPSKKPIGGRVDTNIGPGINIDDEKENIEIDENNNNIYVNDNREDDDIDNNEDSNEDDIEDEKISNKKTYLLLATNSIIDNNINKNMGSKNYLLEGIILAVDMVVKLMCIMSILLIIIICLILAYRYTKNVSMMRVKSRVNAKNFYNKN